jgi:hypothetical protein
VSSDVVKGTRTTSSSRRVLIHIPALSIRTIHSNWRTCVIHMMQSTRKLMTNENSGCSIPTRASARSTSEVTSPSDFEVRSRTRSVAAIANTPSVYASVRRAETVTVGCLSRRIMRTA